MYNAYEAVVIYNKDPQADAVMVMIGSIESRGGKMHRCDYNGAVELAYEIGKYKVGHYCLFQFTIPSDMIDEIVREMNINDTVIRYLITARNSISDQGEVIVGKNQKDSIHVRYDNKDNNVDFTESIG